MIRRRFAWRIQQSCASQESLNKTIAELITDFFKKNFQKGTTFLYDLQAAVISKMEILHKLENYSVNIEIINKFFVCQFLGPDITSLSNGILSKIDTTKDSKL